MEFDLLKWIEQARELDFNRPEPQIAVAVEDKKAVAEFLQRYNDLKSIQACLLGPGGVCPPIYPADEIKRALEVAKKELKMDDMHAELFLKEVTSNPPEVLNVFFSNHFSKPTYPEIRGIRNPKAWPAGFILERTHAVGLPELLTKYIEEADAVYRQ